MLNHQYRTNIQITDKTISLKLFYKHVLFPYRKTIGIWQRQNLKYYSGLLRVIVKNDGLYFEELVPPPNMAADFRILEFLKISYDVTSGKAVIENRSKLAKSETVKVIASEHAGMGA